MLRLKHAELEAYFSVISTDGVEESNFRLMKSGDLDEAKDPS